MPYDISFYNKISYGNDNIIQTHTHASKKLVEWIRSLEALISNCCLFEMSLLQLLLHIVGSHCKFLYRL